MNPTQKHVTPSADVDATVRIAHTSDPAIETILETLLSRLDAEQARAFLRKMAELDAERLRPH